MNLRCHIENLQDAVQVTCGSLIVQPIMSSGWVRKGPEDEIRWGLSYSKCITHGLISIKEKSLLKCIYSQPGMAYFAVFSAGGRFGIRILKFCFSFFPKLSLFCVDFVSEKRRNNQCSTKCSFLKLIWAVVDWHLCYGHVTLQTPNLL